MGADLLALPTTPTNLLQAPWQESFSWFCPPPASEAISGELKVFTATGTDFWQRTHYNFTPDNGHFYHAKLDGDFVIATTISSNPNSKFDQAGLIVRISPSCWIKTSAEFQPDGKPSQLGVVVTNAGYSDWSTMNFPPGIQELSLRIRREGSDYLVEASLPPSAAGAVTSLDAGGAVDAASGWTQLRMAHLLEDTSPSGVAAKGPVLGGSGGSCLVAAGLYACSPLGPGFEVTFRHLTAYSGRVHGGS